MNVELLPEAADELRALPAAERQAIINALEKLRSMGDLLRYPHTSQVTGTQLRELRPRAGRSPWRALYRRSGNHMVVLSIAPEAQQDRRGFARAVAAARQRFEHHASRGSAS